MGDEFIFLASGDAREVCQGLDGTTCTALPHQNCQCTSQPTAMECDTRVDYFGPDEIAPGIYSIGAEVTVTCGDGTELGMTLQHTIERDEDPMGFAFELSDAEDSLCEKCDPAEKPFNCC